MRFAGIILEKPSLSPLRLTERDGLFQRENVDLPRRTEKRGRGGKMKLISKTFHIPSSAHVVNPCACWQAELPCNDVLAISPTNQKRNFGYRPSRKFLRVHERMRTLWNFLGGKAMMLTQNYSYRFARVSIRVNNRSIFLFTWKYWNLNKDKYCTHFHIISYHWK